MKAFIKTIHRDGAGAERSIIGGGKTFLSGTVRSVPQVTRIIWQKKSGPGDVKFNKQRELVMSARSGYSWHVCPCCVGNIPRTLLMIPAWSYVKSDADLYVNLFIGSTVNAGKVN